ncbi:hypothetical protein [Klebsiella pneumoniae IS39]|nr:hypothetical protein [Klebsiella pneumoniae IS39]
MDCIKYLTINRFSRTAFLEPSPFWWYGLAFLKKLNRLLRGFS